MHIINGRKIAQEVIDGLKKLPKPNKTLVAVFVGDDLASVSFLKQKSKVAQDLGLEFKLEQFPETISEIDLKEKIKTIGEDPRVGGIIIQLPLPPKFDQSKIISLLNPKKDVDALTAGAKVLPLAVGVVKDVLEEAMKYENSTNIRNLKDRLVAVVGRGVLIGKPIAEWLSGKCHNVMVLHRGSDFSQLKSADLVVTGAGKAGLIKPEMLKAGAGVIDFGFDMVRGKIRGDFDSSSLTAIPSTLYPSFYTPTPGGTGPILVAELFKNFYKLLSI